MEQRRNALDNLVVMRNLATPINNFLACLRHDGVGGVRVVKGNDDRHLAINCQRSWQQCQGSDNLREELHLAVLPDWSGLLLARKRMFIVVSLVPRRILGAAAGSVVIYEWEAMTRQRH